MRLLAGFLTILFGRIHQDHRGRSPACVHSRWISRAKSSLPVPVSPVTSSEWSVTPSLRAILRTAFRAGLRPTMWYRFSAFVRDTPMSGMTFANARLSLLGPDSAQLCAGSCHGKMRDAGPCEKRCLESRAALRRSARVQGSRFICGTRAQSQPRAPETFTSTLSLIVPSIVVS